MLASTNVDELLERWTRESTDLAERFYSPQLASLTTRHINELREAVRVGEEQTVSLREAARISGYSEGHLGRLVGRGTLTNYGRANAPKVRVGDLPQKTQPLRIDGSENTHSPRKRIVLAACNGSGG